MSIKTTRWKPDTCDYIIQYSWDDSVPVEDRTHSGHKIEKACGYHNGANSYEHYLSVVAENRQKNATRAEFPEALQHKIKFRFDQNRNLTLTLPEELANELPMYKSLIEKKFSNVFVE